MTTKAEREALAAAKKAAALFNAEHPALVCPDAACPWNLLRGDARRLRVWQFAHQLHHNPGTYSVGSLADRAGCSEAEALAVVMEACTIKLAMVVDHSGTAQVFAGYRKPKGTKTVPAKAKRAQAFGQAAASLW